MNYLIGDLQGCCDALERLLATLDFSPSRDRLYLLGDLVNRGPASLATLRRLQGLGDAARCLLGNHDLHLLAAAAGTRKPHRSDTLSEILDAPDREALLEWLRHQRLALHEQGWLMVHAGVVPQWDAVQTLALAGEVEALLRGPDLQDFLQQMYGNEPLSWDESLVGTARWRFIVNVLTRLRFCDAQGRLDLKTKDADGAPEGFQPWFDVPGRRTADTPIAFGHWSTLGLLQRADLLALDTGCVWGGRLTAARVEAGRVLEIIQVDCAQAQKPGLA
ncbi:symmetrical bis(5'-nucleosyl)-tetraphosphatase [Paucibacter sp. PLA-PC-4]|uniref:symmetrical bis(5'-nucleosyl)-tetraphosphatase n=1 Tax=Paucibacter sp. PLA-PC-4 TaxID=2993655 RepID=UPI0022489EE1|nr:symmetrical bis(5'-nucleosyl)-tetraphosphatase [Paucibacter sp. PLA-PC-4]MCX2861146.1 symmetrical bis(5'-nucleosyl)-tetraphosphatase [Paucibacter sp. PLA-PC-4]